MTGNVRLGRLRLAHPLLFAAYPVLFLYAHNPGRFAWTVIVRPLLVVEAFGLLAWGAAAILCRSLARGALLASAGLLLFFSFGPISGVLGNAGLRLAPGWGPNRILFLVEAAVFLALAWPLVRPRRSSGAGWTRAAGVMALLLVAIPLVQIGISGVHPGEHAASPVPVYPLTHPRDSKALPDIFLVILDAYGRADVLADEYSFDNSPFVHGLEQLGFHVLDRSRSNYPQTTLSLAATLSMTYLDSLAAQMGPENTDRGPLRRRIQNSRVARSLKRIGYRTAAYATGYHATEARNADRFLSHGPALNEFEEDLFSSTPLPAVSKSMGRRQEDLHRKQILYTLDHLADALSPDSPVFVLAHVICPHPPFVFGPGGEPRGMPGRFTMADGSDLWKAKGVTPEEYIAGYRDQVRYLNTRVLAGLRRLIQAERRPLIVLVQGDHGPGAHLDFESAERTDMRERLSILDAWLLPDSIPPPAEDMSPVNNFRYLFARLFGAPLGLLENRSYFATESHPYQFLDVTARVLAPATTRGPGAAPGRAPAAFSPGRVDSLRARGLSAR